MTPDTAPPSPDAPPARSSSRKALWIVLGVVGFIALCIVAFAAFGFYFVTQNLDMTEATASEASLSFDDVRAKFKDGPILRIDPDERVTLTRPPPDSAPAERPTHMYVMAYDPDDQRIVRVTVPFWMLRLGRENIRLGAGGDGDIQFEQLRITAEELERYGPTLLVDHTERGNRVLVWTQ